MTGRRSVETPIEDTFTKYLTDKGKGDAGEEGAYRTDAERELHRFRRWCLGNTSDSANATPPESWAGVVDGDTVRFADLDTTVFSDYARYLSTAGYAAGTVLTYYAHVASWCGWAHAQGYLPRHYARESDAEDPLPENDGRRPGDQQAWEPIHRDLITQFVDRRVSEAFDALGAIEVPHADRGDPESETVAGQTESPIQSVPAVSRTGARVRRRLHRSARVRVPLRAEGGPRGPQRHPLA
ncbi:MAG: hypothetical protein U5K00_10445 [Melioribacteraceae bacterium]|nr:hypothetical protein [Melioribacteraceae bacterium]